MGGRRRRAAGRVLVGRRRDGLAAQHEVDHALDLRVIEVLEREGGPDEGRDQPLDDQAAGARVDVGLRQRGPGPQGENQGNRGFVGGHVHGK